MARKFKLIILQIFKKKNPILIFKKIVVFGAKIQIGNFNLFYFSDAHTSSLMMSDSDSEDEEIIFDDDLNRKPMMHNGVGANVNKRNGIAKAKQNARA